MGCCLISVLLGPVRMLTYLFMHGLAACSMSTTWALGFPWLTSVAIAAAVRTIGLLGYLAVSSLTMNENLFQLLLNNVYCFMDQILATANSSLTPAPVFVISTLGVLMV